MVCQFGSVNAVAHRQNDLSDALDVKRNSIGYMTNYCAKCDRRIKRGETMCWQHNPDHDHALKLKPGVCKKQPTEGAHLRLLCYLAKNPDIAIKLGYEVKI